VKRVRKAVMEVTDRAKERLAEIVAGKDPMPAGVPLPRVTSSLSVLRGDILPVNRSNGAKLLEHRYSIPHLPAGGVRCCSRAELASGEEAFKWYVCTAAIRELPRYPATSMTHEKDTLDRDCISTSLVLLLKQALLEIYCCKLNFPSIKFTRYKLY
jgi:hypothetical protein